MRRVTRKPAEHGVADTCGPAAPGIEPHQRPPAPGAPQRPHRPEPGTGLTLPRTAPPPQTASRPRVPWACGAACSPGSCPLSAPLVPLASARASLCFLLRAALTGSKALVGRICRFPCGVCAGHKKASVLAPGCPQRASSALPASLCSSVCVCHSVPSLCRTAGGCECHMQGGSGACLGTWGRSVLWTSAWT